MKKILFGFLAVIYAFPVMAVKPSGTIVDENGEPLIGATLAYQESGTGFAYTGVDGKISQVDTDMAPETEIKISYLGYKDLILPASKISGTVKMEPDTEVLEASVIQACADAELKELNAKSGNYNTEQKRCVPTACITPRYELEFGGTDLANCVDQVGMPCYDFSGGATAGEYAIVNDKFTCAATECITDEYKIENGECVSRLGDDCTSDAKKGDKNIDSAAFDMNYLTFETFCRVTKCNPGYKVNDDETACIEMLKECTSEQANKLKENGASETGIKTGTEECIALSCVCGYDLNKDKGQCEKITEPKPCSDKTKPKLPKNAKAGVITCENGVAVCKIESCDGVEFELDKQKNQCIKQTGKDCSANDSHAVNAKYEKRNNKMVCVIKKCTDTYAPAADGLSCVLSEGDCTKEQLAALDVNATKGKLQKQKCTITECKPGMVPEKNKCVEISGPCKNLPENATYGHIKYDKDKKVEICLVDGCKGGFKPSADKLSCVADAESQKKIEEARAKYNAANKNEQSLANRMLGGATMGAMGIGSMMIGSALSEQTADADAERDMAAYLATFKCDYGMGKNIKGGEIDVELPGASELIPLYAEYVTLANDLKIRKSQLGLKAGIESEKILDSATTGLYDDVSTGITSGAYASLSRALQNPDGEDAKKWAEQKDKTAQNLQTGAITAGAGAGVGLVGNVVNTLVSNKESNCGSGQVWDKQKKQCVDNESEK